MGEQAPEVSGHRGQMRQSGYQDGRGCRPTAVWAEGSRCEGGHVMVRGGLTWEEKDEKEAVSSAGGGQRPGAGAQGWSWDPGGLEPHHLPALTTQPIPLRVCPQHWAASGSPVRTHCLVSALPALASLGTQLPLLEPVSHLRAGTGPSLLA